MLAVAALFGPAKAAASSPFAWRGVVNSYYGQPYSHAERMRLLRFMAGQSMNVYLHAPKDELRQRALWRQPYTAQELSGFSAEITYAQAHAIKWIPALTPALAHKPTSLPAGVDADPSVCFSCPAELDVLMNKFEPFWDQGLRTFAVDFDDVRRELPYAADRNAFGTGNAAYARANAHLLNAFNQVLRDRDPSARLITVGRTIRGPRTAITCTRCATTSMRGSR